MTPYKQRLYDAYVSSGQGSLPANTAALPEMLFKTNRPYVDSIIRPLLPTDKMAAIVDLGCGNGCFIYFFKKYGYLNLVGIDASAEQVKVANELGLQEVRQGHIHQFLTAHKESKDVFLLMDVIEHLTVQETFDLLDLVHSQLKPGGKLIMHVPNAEGLFGMRIRYGDLTHEQCFTTTSVQQLLKTVGFNAIICKEEKPVVHGLISLLRRVIWELGTLNYRLLLLAETGLTGSILSQNMLVVATK
ncbi:class I SAM-dependent methyltransferase [uncultured Fibrella sp.]|uniref:class I SAM-dependent methyltransferase n=1 Tax=uncultured Fibrella sp. TaxID=1284596 RepID=UPI0035CAB99D